MSIENPDNVVLASMMGIRRAEDQVAIELTVTPGDLLHADPRQPLRVVGIFQNHEHVEKVRDALADALEDAGNQPNGGSVNEEQATTSKSEERKHHESMIERVCQNVGLTIDDWSLQEDDARVQAHLGRWHPIQDIEEKGLFADEPGELLASVVGSTEYHNERVSFLFVTDGRDMGEEVEPFEVEPEE